MNEDDEWGKSLLKIFDYIIREIGKTHPNYRKEATIALADLLLHLSIILSQDMWEAKLIKVNIIENMDKSIEKRFLKETK